MCDGGNRLRQQEYLARELYTRSQWRNGNFVAINCAALPEHLIESELFGYVPVRLLAPVRKAISANVVEADGGVLFLDENRRYAAGAPDPVVAGVAGEKSDPAWRQHDLGT